MKRHMGVIGAGLALAAGVSGALVLFPGAVGAHTSHSVASRSSASASGALARRAVSASTHRVVAAHVAARAQHRTLSSRVRSAASLRRGVNRVRGRTHGTVSTTRSAVYGARYALASRSTTGTGAFRGYGTRYTGSARYLLSGNGRGYLRGYSTTNAGRTTAGSTARRCPGM